MHCWTLRFALLNTKIEMKKGVVCEVNKWAGYAHEYNNQISSLLGKVSYSLKAWQLTGNGPVHSKHTMGAEGCNSCLGI